MLNTFTRCEVNNARASGIKAFPGHTVDLRITRELQRPYDFAEVEKNLGGEDCSGCLSTAGGCVGSHSRWVRSSECRECREYRGGNGGGCVGNPNRGLESCEGRKDWDRNRGGYLGNRGGYLGNRGGYLGNRGSGCWSSEEPRGRRGNDIWTASENPNRGRHGGCRGIYGENRGSAKLHEKEEDWNAHCSTASCASFVVYKLLGTKAIRDLA